MDLEYAWLSPQRPLRDRFVDGDNVWLLKKHSLAAMGIASVQYCWRLKLPFRPVLQVSSVAHVKWYMYSINQPLLCQLRKVRLRNGVGSGDEPGNDTWKIQGQSRLPYYGMHLAWEKVEVHLPVPD